MLARRAFCRDRTYVRFRAHCAIVISIAPPFEPRQRRRRNPRKNTLAGWSVLLLDWSRCRGADSSDCLVEDSGVGLVVAAVTRSATTHELLLQTLSLFPTLFPALSPGAIYLAAGFSHLRRSSLSKITALSAPALVYHHLLSTTFTIKWPRNCDCFT